MKRGIFLFLGILFIGLFGYEASWAEGRYYIEMSISKCRLWLYEVENGQKKLISEHIISTVKPSIKEFALGPGTVTGIEFDPVWRPTKKTRNEFAKKGIILPLAVPFGDPLNYMGAFKIYLSHSVPGKGKVYRIHGTRAVDEKLLGKRVSGGCFRMRNSEGLWMARLLYEDLGNNIPVNITM